MTNGSTWAPYCGAAPDPAALAGAWNLDPVLLAALLLAAVLVPRLTRDRDAAWGAIGVAAVLFVSPVCALTSALFAARAVHHVVLAGVVAPLFARALPVRGGTLVAATVASVGAMYLWHVPAVYAVALANDGVFWLLQIALLAASTWFWAAVRAAPAPAAVAALLVTMVAMGLLGALLTLAPAALYGPHLATTWAWGLAPIEDQQIAGLVMWVPAGGLYLAAALAIGWRALGGAEPARV